MTSPAYRPRGRILTPEDAATLAGKSLATVYRWVAQEHVRPGHLEDGNLGVSENDIIAMRSKRWQRRPRPRHADVTGA